MLSSIRLCSSVGVSWFDHYSNCFFSFLSLFLSLTPTIARGRAVVASPVAFGNNRNDIDNFQYLYSHKVLIIIYMIYKNYASINTYSGMFPNTITHSLCTTSWEILLSLWLVAPPPSNPTSGPKHCHSCTGIGMFIWALHSSRISGRTRHKVDFFSLQLPGWGS